MAEETACRDREPSQSARLVAACRWLAAELRGPERLIDDPFAGVVVNEAAIAAARADEPLQNVIRLRTRYIDDAILAFAAVHPEPQVVLLGAGFDTRAYRLGVVASYFEIDFPGTIDQKKVLLADHQPKARRLEIPLDLAEQQFVSPLLEVGYVIGHPTILVWEGVSMYLSSAAAEGVIAQISELLCAGDRVVADYAEMSWLRGTDLERNTAPIAQQLSHGGERLRAGLQDMRATLDANGLDVVDDIAIEDIRARYGLEPRARFYPARMVTAVRRSVDPAV